MPIAAMVLVLIVQAPAPAPLVRGVVTDASGRPLEGVLVAVDTSAGLAVTDKDGAFAVSIPASGHPPNTLTASLPGYRRVEVRIPQDGSVLRIVLLASLPTFTSSVTVT